LHVAGALLLAPAGAPAGRMTGIEVAFGDVRQPRGRDGKPGCQRRDRQAENLPT